MKSETVLLSALLQWCDRVKSDREGLQRCKRSLEDASLLRQEVKDGYPLCTLLDEAVSKLYGDYLSAGRLLGWVSFPRVLEAIRDDGGNPLRFCVSKSTDLTERLRPFPTLGFGDRHLSEYKSIPRDTASEATLKTVKQWLHGCTTDHPLCSKDDNVKLPSRVICIGTKASEVRLLKTNGNAGRYACLSHPWGKRPLLRTLKKNLSQFTEEIQWSALPPTFRDAIDFTRRLGLKYIWIDSLCIIQDDPLDWQREAAKMADIYQNAFITLAASKAVDSSRGLYTSSLDPKHQAQALSLVNDVDDSKVMLHAYSELLHIDSFWSYFPITKRAWVFQERLLSGRVVHFAGSEVNWECRSKMMCECGEISTSTSLPEKIQFSGSLAELSGQYSSIAEEQSPSAQGNGQNDDLDYSKFTPALLRSPK
ncbi:heterokaryon incompatibility protein-domain-containing protein [Colletotrichum phormii]|uniref:Heterokaryon incompatibility protein-domain-containing protein n=1 Tax=Colletotrichum phormii TaxID=359342 RepID=A0AAJ0EN09_9PEZI|nr:heterokaryon incompatibility protein-domain-containing protein [Colletotrichum phormii]KAK1655008.1 heterokaryon incompatibility protein-domain-containing protein [Colletotrichum phormii]